MQLSLLALGRLLFHGPLVDLVPWFASLGYSHIKGGVFEPRFMAVAVVVPSSCAAACNNGAHSKSHLVGGTGA